MMKRVFAIFLTCVFLLGLLPTSALAAEPDSGGLCPHHQEHSYEICGYMEAVEEQPCGHIHDGVCGFVEAEEEIPCNMDCAETSEDGQIIHGEGCAYAPAAGDPCQHEHDGGCGYAEAVEGRPCGYVCPIYPVQALIDDLPPSEGITADNRTWVEDQLEAIDEVRAGLTDAEAGQLDNSRYQAVVSALSELDGQAGNDLPMPAAEGVVVGPFTVEGGAEGTDYKYENSTLTISGSVSLTISGTTTSDKILIADGVTANVTLDNVSINVSGITYACAFEVARSASCNLTLTGKNTLKSGDHSAGLQVQNGAVLVIMKGSTGSLNVTGGDWGGAGIGGGSGEITINGGTVTATGGNYGAGIGGGMNKDGGTVTINGGTVIATAGRYEFGCAGIGDGYYNTSGKQSSFGTGENGHAFIITTGDVAITNTVNKVNWSGVIFEKNEGKVYGGPIELTTNAEIPGDKTLTIESDKTLTVGSGVTLTVNSTLKIEDGGTLTVNGSIGGNGKIEPETAKLSQAGQSAAPTKQAATANSITLQAVTGGANGVEYGYVEGSTGGTPATWQDNTTFSSLSAGTAYTFYSRYKGNGFYKPSEASSGTTLYTAYAAPGANEGYSINYTNETIAVNSDYAVNTAQNFSGTPINNDASISSYIGQSLYIRKAASGSIPASESVDVTIPARPDTPEPGVVNESVEGKADGEITGLIAGTAYQISSNGGKSWTDATLKGTKITDLAPGNYRVRVKAVENSAFASEPSEVVKIESGPPRTYELKVTAPTFKEITYGDDQPAAETILIENTGNSDATISSVTVSGGDFTISSGDYTVPAKGFIDTWKVQPNVGLSARVHTATITVTYKGGDPATAQVSIQVKDAPQDAPTDAPELDSKTHNSVTLKPVPSNDKGAMAEYSYDGKTWQTSREFSDLPPARPITLLSATGPSKTMKRPKPAPPWKSPQSPRR